MMDKLEKRTFSTVNLGSLEARKRFTKQLIGKTVKIKGIEFNPGEHFIRTGEHFKHLVLPEYGIGLFLLDNQIEDKIDDST